MTNAPINPLFETREAYLQEAASLILDDCIMPAVEAKGFDFPRPRFRISMGFPPNSRASQKVIAVCFVRAASSDGVNEIFINPTIDDAPTVLDSIAHELIHATDDCKSGHRNFFASIARKIGLEGKLTETHAGPALATTLEGIANLLGPFPHHKMDIQAGRKIGGTRLLKVECRWEDCKFSFRTSQKQIDKMVSHDCPACLEANSLELV